MQIAALHIPVSRPCTRRPPPHPVLPVPPRTGQSRPQHALRL